MFNKVILSLAFISWNLTADQIISDKARYTYEVFYSKLAVLPAAPTKPCYQCTYEGTYVGMTKFGGYCLRNSKEWGERERGPDEEEVRRRAQRKAAAFCDFPHCGCTVDEFRCEKLELPTAECTVFP